MTIIYTHVLTVDVSERLFTSSQALSSFILSTSATRIRTVEPGVERIGHSCDQDDVWS